MPMSVARNSPDSRLTATADDRDDADDTKKAPVHRTFFPETWLWRLERMRSVPCEAVLGRKIVGFTDKCNVM